MSEKKSSKKTGDQPVGCCSCGSMDILTNAPIGIFTSTPDGSFLSVNPALSRMYGYETSDDLIRSITDFDKQLYANAAYRKEFKRLLKKHGELTNFEYQLVHRSGSVYWVSTNARAVRDSDGNITHYEGFTTDISERKNAEAKYQTLFREMLNAFSLNEVICNEAGEPVDYRFLDVNPAYESMTGMAADDIVGRTALEIFPATRKDSIALFGGVALTGISARFETYSGEVDRYLDVNVFRPAPNQFACQFIDITDRKKAEIRLARLNEALFQLGDDIDANIERLTMLCGDLMDATCAIYNRLDEGMLCSVGRWRTPPDYNPRDKPDGHLCYDVIKNAADGILLVHNLSQTRYAITDPNVLRFGLETYVGHPVYHRDTAIGSLCVVFQTNVAITQEDEKLLGILASALGVLEERREATIELKSSERRFLKVFNSSPAPQAISDTDTGKLIDVNKRWLEMLGYTKEAVIGRTTIELGMYIDPKERQRFSRKLKTQGFFRDEPVTYRASSGKHLKLLWSAEFITIDGKQVMLSMFYDETKRKQDEKEREKLQSQLNQAQKMESVGRLAGGVAHDFNNKLAIINGYAEMAMEMMDSSTPLREMIQEVHTAGKQSADIVRQLLAFARQQTISPVLLDLNDTIFSMLKMLQRLIGENIDLAWHPGRNLWPVKIDPSQVDQVMANLAANAQDAISDVGKLTIETKNTIVDEEYCKTLTEAIPGRYVMLAVSDDGHGIEKEVKDQLFEPFFTTKAIGKGTGLGLSTIYGILKQNKGFVSVYSEPGEGTTFKIYFPSHETKKPSLHSISESSEKMPTGTEIILVVEDEKAILEISRQMLERLGYTVHTAGTPSEALRFSRAHDGKIHLLITDVVMPGMNGRDLSLKLTQARLCLKTLYMSGYTADVIAHHGVLDEGVQFIQKPFSLKDLAVKVREVLKQD